MLEMHLLAWSKIFGRIVVVSVWSARESFSGWFLLYQMFMEFRKFLEN